MEPANLTERMKESYISHPIQSSIVGGRSVTYEKYKEIGNSELLRKVDSCRSLALDTSSARSSREEMFKGNKLKAATEVTMFKKPGIYRENKFSDQSDELSASSRNCDVASQDQLLSSGNIRNIINVEKVYKCQAIAQNSIINSGRQTTVNKLKHFNLFPADTVAFGAGDASPIVTSDGKPSIRDLLSHAFAAISPILEMSPIPEHEFIWRGAFEVYRTGEAPDLCDRIQAHLSTCASPKVLEAVNTFPHKVILNEVPRLSTWPIQFQESGVKEDDIALLIFPSNQLPEKSQRWNTFFPWGVFRGKRVSCLQQVPGCPKQFSVTRAIPRAIMSLPENICSLGTIDKNSPASDGAVASEASASIESSYLSSSKRINGNCDRKEGCFDHDCKEEAEKQTSIQATGKCEKMPMHRDQNAEELNNWHFNQRKRPHVDPAEMMLQAASASTSQPTTWNDIDSMLVVEGSASKKQKTDFGGFYGSDIYTSSLRGGFASKMHDAGIMDRLHVRPPNLELALGAEAKLSKQGFIPFLVGKVANQDQPTGKAATKEEEEDVSAPLSLSLLFPFSGKEQDVKPV